MKIYKLKEPVTGYKAGTLVTPIGDLSSDIPMCMTVKLDLDTRKYVRKEYIYPRWEMMEEVE